MFKELLSEFDRTIEVADVGAGINIHGISQDIYYDLYDKGLCKITGFEANEDELEKRNSAYGADDGICFLPYVIGDGNKATFHINRSPATSSLLVANLPLLKQFQRLSGGYITVEEKDVTTARLDDIEELTRPDFIKLDVQGAEAMVIEGGRDTFANALVVYAEVFFVEAYVGQPLFSDIDQMLRSMGYCFSNFIRQFSRQMTPMVLDNSEFTAGGQLLWCDGGIWVKHLFALDLLDDDDLAVSAAIMHHAYTSVDVVGHMLHELDRRRKSDWLNRYIVYMQS